MGHNMFLPTEASGEAVVGIAGRTVMGDQVRNDRTVQYRYCQCHDQLIEAQRAYQFDLRIAKIRMKMMHWQ